MFILSIAKVFKNEAQNPEYSKHSVSFFLSFFFNPVMLDKEALPTSYLNLFARCSQSEVGLEGVGPKTEGPNLR